MGSAAWTRPHASYSHQTIVGLPGVRAVWRLAGGSTGSRHTVAKLYPALVAVARPGDTGRVVARRPGLVTTPLVGDVVGVELEMWLAPLLDDLAADVRDRYGSGGHSFAAEVAESLQCLGIAPPEAAVVAATAAMVEHPTRQMVRGVAREVGWSARTLRRKLSTAVGMSPDEIRRLARVQVARDLLAAGLEPVRVAAQLEFADQPHLNREFARWCGYTPTEWRSHTAAWTPHST